MNSLSRLLHCHLALFASVLLLIPAARAEDDEADPEIDGGSTARVQFSNPAKPGTLKISLPWAEARISATDGNEVIVTSTLEQKGRMEVDHEGFRRLDEDVTFEIVEKDNVATLLIAGDNQWAAHGAEFNIKVPRSTNLYLRTDAGGDIAVNGVEGDIEISSMNGDVTLRDIGSSAIVNTMNGEISATFKRPPQKAVSLSSMNGEIDLRLPVETKANLRMRTHNGSIRTNFAPDVLQAKTEKSRRDANSSADRESQREIEREVQREMARADRENARVAKEVARVTADAVRVAVKAAADVEAAVNRGEYDSFDRIAPVPPVPPIPPIPNFGGKTIVGTLNGGGVDIKLTSMNGGIVLRENK